MSKHTPGPWRVTLGSHDFVVYTGEAICQGDDTMVAWRVNAVLISEAPTLLKALKDCITYEGSTAERDHKSAMRRLEYISSVAREAIERAEGE